MGRRTPARPAGLGSGWASPLPPARAAGAVEPRALLLGERGARGGAAEAAEAVEAAAEAAEVAEVVEASSSGFVADGLPGAVAALEAAVAGVERASGGWAARAASLEGGARGLRGQVRAPPPRLSLCARRCVCARGGVFVRRG